MAENTGGPSKANLDFSPQHVETQRTGDDGVEISHHTGAIVQGEIIDEKCRSTALTQFKEAQNIDERVSTPETECQNINPTGLIGSGDHPAAVPSFKPLVVSSDGGSTPNQPQEEGSARLDEDKLPESRGVGETAPYHCIVSEDNRAMGDTAENFPTREGEVATEFKADQFEIGCGDDMAHRRDQSLNIGDSTPISILDVENLEHKIDASPGATTSACAPVASPKPFAMAPDLIHHVKWISWHGVKTPVMTQNENGPCPLLAIINVLLLRGQVRLVDGIEIMTTQQLLERLGDCIIRLIPKEMAQRPDYQQNVSDSLCILPKLSTGLDVNVKFTGVSEFEYTPECIVFDLINIGLYHGWLFDHATQEEKNVGSVIGNLSYNQLVERIIDNKSSGDSAKVSEALLAEQFLEASASQLTNFGLKMLKQRIKDGELSVFFRNNHFSTLLKHEGSLLLLVTDLGFLNEHDVIWETLDDVGGNSKFLNAEFKLAPPKSPGAITKTPVLGDTNDKQMENDLLIAMTLSREDQSSQIAGTSVESDLQLALRLQEEENRRSTARIGDARLKSPGGQSQPQPQRQLSQQQHGQQQQPQRQQPQPPRPQAGQGSATDQPQQARKKDKVKT